VSPFHQKVEEELPAKLNQRFFGVNTSYHVLLLPNTFPKLIYLLFSAGYKADFLGAFAKLRKICHVCLSVSLSAFLSVCLSVGMEQLDFH
jgi:hypothetical protein